MQTVRRRRFGTATLETAVSLPLLVILVFGVIEMANAVFLKQSMNLAAYEAAQAQAEGVRVLTALGIGNGATVTVVDELTEVTVTVAVPAANVSWGLTRFCYGLTLRQWCTLTKE